MRPSFAFTSGFLDRAAHLRPGGGPRTDSNAQTLVFWRGKLLADGEGDPVLARLDHPALGDAREAPVFLGLTAEGPRFAVDLPLWSPPEDAATIGEFVDQSQQVHPAWPQAHFAEIRGLMPTLFPLEGETVATARALLGWHGTHRFCSNCGKPTEIESAGWVRKCPDCATQHFPRTDPVVIMAITRGDQLLLGRGPSWPQGMYSLLAGFVEPGETIESAVRREVVEESGILVGPVRYVACQPWPFPMSLMFGCQGEAASEAITIDPVELADARWVTREEVHSILAGTHDTINTPRPGAIAGGLIRAWAEGKLLDPAYWDGELSR
ncbi:NAD(+) diphosphatase [Devosia submarina]|uniref:NAD(+) diphosphatase n=1 Tax=Devosia submarina TaxID=1173082 RepID=UPI000D36F496|nr:NAD(+) diphosphatase [Devosia submarina]